MILESIEILDSNLEMTLGQLETKVTNGDYDDLLSKYNLLIIISDGLVLVNRSDKSCKVIAPTDLDNYVTHSKLVPQSYRDIQTIVRAGLAPFVFNIGDQITVSKGSTELVWDIIGIDHDTPADSSYSHSLTLQLHDCLSTSLLFDAAEATWYIDEATYPAGLAAGTYQFTTAGGSTYNFTLTKTVPAGGQMRYDFSSTVKTYASKGSTTELESVSVTAGEAGTVLSTLTNTGVTSITNAEHRTRRGSNNWIESSLRQWLNTDKAGGTWWEPKSNFDRPSNASVDGFLKDMDPEFLSVLGEVTKTTQLSVSDGYELASSTEKVFLLSRAEVYGGVEYPTKGADGLPYAYYGADYSDLTSAGTSNDPNRIKNKSGAAAWWWLRSAYAGNGDGVRYVDSTGIVNNYDAYSSGGVNPACVII